MLPVMLYADGAPLTLEFNLHRETSSTHLWLQNLLVLLSGAFKENTQQGTAQGASRSVASTRLVLRFRAARTHELNPRIDGPGLLRDAKHIDEDVISKLRKVWAESGREPRRLRIENAELAREGARLAKANEQARQELVVEKQKGMARWQQEQKRRAPLLAQMDQRRIQVMETQGERLREARRRRPGEDDGAP
jgi:hypothetical protein